LSGVDGDRVWFIEVQVLVGKDTHHFSPLIGEWWLKWPLVIVDSHCLFKALWSQN
jgi:hypothetical protein